MDIFVIQMTYLDIYYSNPNKLNYSWEDFFIYVWLCDKELINWNRQLNIFFQVTPRIYIRKGEDRLHFSVR